MQLGICAGPDVAPSVKDAGVDYLEVNVQGYLKPRDDDAAFSPNLEAAKASLIPVRAANCFLPGDLPSTGPDVDRDAICQWSAVAFERATKVGIEAIVFGSGGSRQLRDGETPADELPAFVELLKLIGPIAHDHNVTVVIEPLRRAECNFINTLAEGAEAVEKADHPNVRLLADFYHMLNNEEDPADVGKYGHLLNHCHFAEKTNRTPCGVDGDDFRPFLKGLASSGYNSRLSFEGRWPDGGPQQHAAAVITEMRKQLADAGL